jgi:hypothetical protein
MAMSHVVSRMENLDADDVVDVVQQKTLQTDPKLVVSP